MEPLILVAKGSLYLVMLGTLVAAVGVVLLPNIFHSALCLVAALLGVALLYLALQAEFIAIVQVLLYVGAVMTLVIFAIMLTQRIGERSIPQTNRQSLPAFVVLLALVTLVGSLLVRHPWVISEASPRVDVLALGKGLLGEFVFPFEVVSIVLLAGLIGAVVIARRD